MALQDMREFLAVLEQQGLLRRVGEEVDAECLSDDNHPVDRCSDDEAVDDLLRACACQLCLRALFFENGERCEVRRDL